MSDTRSIARVRSRQLSTSWRDRFARHLVFSTLENLEGGRLVVEDGDETRVFGQEGETDLVATIQVHHPSVYRCFAFGGSIGAGEAYMQGGWDSPSLLNVIRIFARNLDSLRRMEVRWPWLQGLVDRVLHLFRANTLEGSRKNISAHYDLSNDFFSLFLDPTMMYSSAIYSAQAATLEQASVYKLDCLCRQLDLRPDDHLLEIGTGWGGLAIHAAKHYGCRVTTTTISREQYNCARERVRSEGLEDRIELLLEDYRHLQGQYDKLVSVEMIEAVGHPYYADYFSLCSRLLKPDGLMAIQAITVPDQRYEMARDKVDFIKKYIFPGGSLPSVSVMAERVRSHTDMAIVGLRDIGLDYARTLRDWNYRFHARLDDVRALGFDAAFCRMWNYYLNYCEGGFRERSISTVQILLAKPGARIIPAPVDVP